MTMSSEEITEIFRCPHCAAKGKGLLAAVKDNWLSCDCGRQYPIFDGIPIMLPDEGEKWFKLPVDELPGAEESIDLLRLDEALGELETRDPRMAQVVKLRFFAGLTVEQTAGALGVTSRTVDRDWTGAKAWLARHMGHGEREPSP